MIQAAYTTNISGSYSLNFIAFRSMVLSMAIHSLFKLLPLRHKKASELFCMNFLKGFLKDVSSFVLVVFFSNCFWRAYFSFMDALHVRAMDSGCSKDDARDFGFQRKVKYKDIQSVDIKGKPK